VFKIVEKTLLENSRLILIRKFDSRKRLKSGNKLKDDKVIILKKYSS